MGKQKGARSPAMLGRSFASQKMVAKSKQALHRGFRYLNLKILLSFWDSYPGAFRVGRRRHISRAELGTLRLEISELEKRAPGFADHNN
jgi:hypothetical protein